MCGLPGKRPHGGDERRGIAAQPQAVGHGDGDILVGDAGDDLRRGDHQQARGLELAHRIDTVAFDKTGTLTEGKPQVSDLLPLAEVDENGLLALAAAAEAGSEHPRGRAVVAAASARNERSSSRSVTRMIPWGSSVTAMSPESARRYCALAPRKVIRRSFSRLE